MTEEIKRHWWSWSGHGKKADTPKPTSEETKEDI